MANKSPEQFSPKGRVGAWSDLYALAQCFLHLLPKEHKKRYPRQLLRSLQKAAAPDVSDRFLSAQDWLKALHKTSFNKAAFFLPAALLAGGIIGVLGLHAFNEHKQVPVPQQPAATTNPTPTPGFPPETIVLSDGTIIYDSSGQLASNDPRIKERAERLHAQYTQALLIYLGQAEEQGIPKQEQQQTMEKLRADWENKLRELRRD